MSDVTPIRTAAENALIAAFPAARKELPGNAQIIAMREKAFDRFQAKGLPHRRVEEWKYTDLRAALREALPLASAPDAAALAAIAGPEGVLTGNAIGALLFGSMAVAVAYRLAAAKQAVVDHA